MRRLETIEERAPIVTDTNWGWRRARRSQYIHVEISQNFAYGGTVDLLLTLRVAKRERVEADVVYDPRNPVAVRHDLVYCVKIE